MPIVVVTGSGTKVKNPLRFGLMRGGGILAGVCLTLAIVFSAISWPPYADFLLDKQGISTQAVVLTEPIIVSRHKYSRDPNRIAFEVKFTQLEEAVKITSRPTLGIVPGTQIEIKYLPNNPAIARIKGDSYGIFGYKVILIMFGGVLAGLVILFVGTQLKKS